MATDFECAEADGEGEYSNIARPKGYASDNGIILRGYSLNDTKNLLWFEFDREWITKFKRAARIYGGDFTHLFQNDTVVSEIRTPVSIGSDVTELELGFDSVVAYVDNRRSGSSEHSEFELGLEKFVLVSGYQIHNFATQAKTTLHSTNCAANILFAAHA